MRTAGRPWPLAVRLLAVALVAAGAASAVVAEAAQADLSARARELSRRLLAAAGRGDTAHVQALLREGADPNARDEAGRPALLAAASAARGGAVRALLRAGAAVDAADRGGWTALHQAADTNDLATARVLLEAGATPDLRSRAYGTALDVAEREGRSEMARLLRAHGARGSGKSIGDTVCVRPWKGEGYCGVIETVERARFRLRLSRLVGCVEGCAPDPDCSGGRPVGGRSGLAPGERISIPSSCLTHTGLSE